MTYASLLDFAATIEEDIQGNLSPRDPIDLQSFIWAPVSSRARASC